MSSRSARIFLSLSVLIFVAATAATAQSFMVQCPTSTTGTHPNSDNNSEPAYTAPTTLTLGPNGYMVPTSATVNGAIKCQQISGGDGYATMGDGTQTYMFSFGPLSGLADLAAGKPATQFPNIFNTSYACATVLQPGDPATTEGGGTVADLASFTYNGAIGQVPDLDNG